MVQKVLNATTASATGINAIRSMIAAPNCWIICRLCTSIRKLVHFHAYGSAARCTIRNRARVAGWNDTCYHMEARNNSNALLKVAACVSVRR